MLKTQFKHIQLIGFKHVGKSTIGKALAEKIQWPFFDLDQKIESNYEKQNNKKLSCRDIMKQHGEFYFRDWESQALSDMMPSNPSIIALGGGAPMHPAYQNSAKFSVIIHITAPQNKVFERILKSGHPAFIHPHDDLGVSLNQLWDERKKVYEAVRDCVIENNTSIDDAVNQIVGIIK